MLIVKYADIYRIKVHN